MERKKKKRSDVWLRHSKRFQLLFLQLLGRLLGITCRPSRGRVAPAGRLMAFCSISTTTAQMGEG